MQPQFTYCDVLAAATDNYNLLPVEKPNKQWTWKNDSEEHKLHHIDSVNFSVVIKFKEVVEFAITFFVSYIEIVTK